jgi:antirestriction protein ArdC
VRNYKELTAERAKASLDGFIELLKGGCFPEQIALTFIEPASANRPCSLWSLGNRLITVCNNTRDARGIRQWNEAKRLVNKGSHAFFIWIPMVQNWTDKETEEKKQALLGFKPAPVFRIEDTDGDPVEEEDYHPNVMPPLLEVAEHYGIDVQYIPRTSNFAGCYIPGMKTIQLATHDVNVFFHELSHVVHAEIIKEAGRKVEDEPIGTQEIVAETVATSLARAYGIEGYELEAAKYIAAYEDRSESPESALRGIMKTIAMVQKVMGRIIIEANTIERSQAA